MTTEKVWNVSKRTRKDYIVIHAKGPKGYVRVMFHSTGNISLKFDDEPAIHFYGKDMM